MYNRYAHQKVNYKETDFFYLFYAKFPWEPSKLMKKLFSIDSPKRNGVSSKRIGMPTVQCSGSMAPCPSDICNKCHCENGCFSTGGTLMSCPEGT